MVATYILGSAVLVLAIAILLCVSLQQGNSQGLGAMAGSSDADSYYSKNKSHSKDAILSKITVVLSIVLIICIIVMNILAVANG